MQLDLLTNPTVQNVSAILISFVVGVVLKSHLRFRKENSDALDTLTKDYAAMRELYTSAKEEAERLKIEKSSKEQDLLEVRARIKSYENFLQSRSLEVDEALKNIPSFLLAIATHLNITFTPETSKGYEAAHSQAKTTEGNI